MSEFIKCNEFLTTPFYHMRTDLGVTKKEVLKWLKEEV